MIKFNDKDTKFLNLEVITKKSEINNEHISKVHQSTTLSLNENKVYLAIDTNNKEELNNAFQNFAMSNKYNLNLDFEKITNTLSNFDRSTMLQVILVNFGVWSMNVYNKKTTKEKEVIYNVVIKNNKEVKHMMHIVESMNFTRLLQDTPSYEMNSLTFAAMVAEELGSDLSLKISILDKKDIEELEMGLLLAVNRGSEIPPRVLVVEYMGNPSTKENIAIIGKGVTYDTGGYSLKPTPSMVGMKYDMSGAAITAGAMRAIGKLRPKNNIVAVMGLTDNVISAKAVVMDDVMTSMNGLTVEMKNTDAEGRLVMADCITYAIRKKNAVKVIDIATLTGASLVALGTIFTGVWTTNDDDWRIVKNCAKNAIENVWRLPFHQEFTKLMKSSKYADLVNSSTIRWGGANTAAAFLKEFTENKPYIHLDIAPTADVDGKYGTASMMRTLIELAHKL